MTGFQSMNVETSQPERFIDGSRVRLSDGRWLGFAEYGAAEGTPVFAFHGTPGSRSMFAGGDEVAKRLGIRLIAPERPGFGLSTAKSAYRLIDWPADVAALATALHTGRFAILGVSGGGPYAVACAALLPDAITSLALVSPMGPVRPPEGAPVIGSSHHVLFRLLSQISLVTQMGAAAGSFIFQKAPNTVRSALIGRVGPADRAILSRPEVWTYIFKTLNEGLRGGGLGAIQDLRIFGEPWNVPFYAIRAPATVWQGTDDTNVPFSAARHLADLIPSCRFIELKDQGHYWIIDHMEEVFQTLIDAPKSITADAIGPSSA